MVLGLKPMGKPTTQKKNYEFRIQPGAIKPRSSDQRPDAIKNTAKIRYLATLLDGVFWISHSQKTTLRVMVHSIYISFILISLICYGLVLSYLIVSIGSN